MKKVGPFRSIHFKFVLIYVLLILVAMQIIGVYFVRELETQLVQSFKTSLNERITLLAYNVDQAMNKDRDAKSPTLEEEIRSLLHDFVSQDISEVSVIDDKSKVLATSNPYMQNIVGKRTTEIFVKRALVTGEMVDRAFIDQKTGHRMYISATPIKMNNEIKGAIYVIASMENVFSQMRQINKIFATGTGIALAITAVLGILLARTITRPISDMRRQALAMAKGNFSRKVKVYGYDEIGQLAMTFNNLTKKLEEAQATTEGERRKLALVLTHMTDGVIATDRRGKIILINDAALNILNVSRETVLSSSIVDVLGLEDQYTFETLIEERDSLILDFSTEEELYILRASLSVIQKETGFVNGLIVVLHDITEQEKIDQERREFVANVSHELRTPLTTMKSYLEALGEGLWRDEQIAPRFIEVTQTETERMIRLVNDLLRLSKLDSKDYKLNKSWVNFSRYFHKVIDRFELTKNENITFIRKIPDEAIFVEIDEDKITQVLDNIISNALKYSPQGGNITFRVKELNNEILVSVTDEGVGIPKSDLAKVFDRFYRVDKARSRKLGGTGLGLAIAKEVVVAHGGNIWAKSQEHKGTTIFFTLPLERIQEDEWDEV
ncbi:cell wall metabolism sensor histidine kinase WalK [Anoxybacillus rupiensis]|jgi:two-component system, OmpR family, sensor histidine kinase VicK|uniref:histidine kinase n=1 Tax=Anoxybacteroides rupiense TaxID=311460 RepID=A0ABD5IS72_9BACL|nr:MULTISPECIES: cell wall metabolism sensor histidine kinase WalK [Anoxybacillus]MBB3908206.1 two-component system sensor histidine kinase VicK [Anoxybacillus rupiensis]MBS2772333.1 cell wall metabolism sensor histidine kinase WalK [Anoxybacillus rupiensis]MDE8563977.1 cell wall metabolism sensor histidine kinase WalK [Anoxybacillus rupiensis]MED5050281.1 cell wall metabolism sensor histidine kinase WalK [Anoxybacillus rupiensis]QHC05647.1 cell wall metabolism sensor histidine kinase WalK [An